MSSEEKSLAPSQRRLSQARRRGQVGTSRDLVAAAAFAVAVGSLVWFVPRTAALFEGLLATAVAGIAAPPGSVAAGLAATALRDAATLLAGVMGATVAGVIVTSIAANQGLVISMTPLMPKLSNLDPVKGIGRMFGMRGMVELAKGTVRLAAALAATAAVVLVALDALSQAWSCGLGCLGGLTLLMARSVLVALLVIAVIFAIPDVVLQRALFLREMMMTVSERKREQKESFGDPEIRRARNRLRKEQQSSGGATRMGARSATVLIVGREEAVAIRYSKPDTPIPTLVARAQGAERVSNLVAAARAHDVPRHFDGALARGLLEGGRNGGRAPTDLFEGIARALAAARP